MTPQEFFKGWWKYIPVQDMNVALSYASKGEFYPAAGDVFKAFSLLQPRDCKVVILGQDPYPQKGIATGIAFGNSADTPEDKLSPSLEVIKEAAIDYTIPHHVLTFDNTLESWAKQGVLMLNSSLTVKPGTPGSHALYWKPFIEKFLQSFSEWNIGLVYVLFGKQAQSFKNCIKDPYAVIYEVEHPAALARRNEKLPQDLFKNINKLLYAQYGEKIEWYHEEDYGEFNI